MRPATSGRRASSYAPATQAPAVRLAETPPTTNPATMARLPSDTCGGRDGAKGVPSVRARQACHTRTAGRSKTMIAAESGGAAHAALRAEDCCNGRNRPLAAHLQRLHECKCLPCWHSVQREQARDRRRAGRGVGAGTWVWWFTVSPDTPNFQRASAQLQPVGDTTRICTGSPRHSRQTRRNRDSNLRVGLPQNAAPPNCGPAHKMKSALKTVPAKYSPTVPP